MWQFLLQRNHLYSINSSLKFMHSRKHLHYLYLTSHFSSSFPNLYLILWTLSERLLTRLDNELTVNITLSISVNMKDIFFIISPPFLLILLTSFSIKTVKVMYFSVFSPEHLNRFLNFSANSFMINHTHN